MFYGCFEITNSILITDVTFDSFVLFVDYLYTGELRLKEFEEIESLIEIAHCAQKYLIDDLRKKCVEKLSKILSRENLFKIFAKSYEIQLEDFIMSCMYFFVDTVEGGLSLCNVMLSNNSDWLQSPGCFEFLVKNLLDYFGEREDVLVLIKAWSIYNTNHVLPLISSGSLDTITDKLNFDSHLALKINQLQAAFFDVPSAARISKSFHRIYYKPIRPLIIEKNQLSFDVNISFKRFVIINHLMINSRLIPEQFDICDMSNQTYVENLETEIIDKSTNQSIYKDHQVVENVGFNASFKIKFNNRMVLFPYHNYIFRFKWNDEAIGFEYPRAIYSLLEKGDKKFPHGVVQFYEHNSTYCLPFGSIVQGIFYDVIV